MDDWDDHVCGPLCKIADLLDEIDGTPEGYALRLALTSGTAVVGEAMTKGLGTGDADAEQQTMAHFRKCFPHLLTIVSLVNEEFYAAMLEQYPQHDPREMVNDVLALANETVSVSVSESGEIAVEYGE